jgi:hypothetical protein
MIFSRLELPGRKLMESLSLTRNAEIVGRLFMDITVMNSSSDGTVVKPQLYITRFRALRCGTLAAKPTYYAIPLPYVSLNHNSSH